MKYINIRPIIDGNIEIANDLGIFDLHNYGEFKEVSYNIKNKIIELNWYYPNNKVSNIKVRDIEDGIYSLDRRLLNYSLKLVFRNIVQFSILPMDIAYPFSENEVLFEINVKNSEVEPGYCIFEFVFQSELSIKVESNELELFAN